MRTLLAVCLLAFIPSVAAAQAPTAGINKKMAWDQTAASLAEAQGYAYRVYVDGSTSPFLIPAVGVSCVNPGTPGLPFVCMAAFLPMTPGNHSITITAANDSGESLQSVPFAFQFIVVPVPPKNIRLG